MTAETDISQDDLHHRLTRRKFMRAAVLSVRAASLLASRARGRPGRGRARAIRSSFPQSVRRRGLC